MFVYSIFIFSPRNIRFCYAHFWARSKSSNSLQQKHDVMAVKSKMIHNLVMREIFVSRAGELSHAGDRPKYREPPAQVVWVNRYARWFWKFCLKFKLGLHWKWPPLIAYLFGLQYWKGRKCNFRDNGELTQCCI